MSNSSSETETVENENVLKKPSRRKRGFQKREDELSTIANNNDNNETNNHNNDKTPPDNLPL